MALTERRVKDRRIQKTKDLLHEALASLIREKDYDSIVVKEVLNRANVGRSTFYAHFRDKDDLLVSSIHHLLVAPRLKKVPLSAKPYEKMIWFSLPIFEHIDEHRRSGQAKIGTRGRAIIHEHLRQVLAELIVDEAGKAFQRRRKSARAIPPDLLVQYVASTFILVLNWWVESSMLGPLEMNDLFRALVLPTLAATWE